MRKAIKIMISVLLICLSAVLTTAFFGAEHSLDGIANAANDKIGVTVYAVDDSSAIKWSAKIGETEVWMGSGEWYVNESLGAVHSFKTSLLEYLSDNGVIDSMAKATFENDGWNANDYYSVDFVFPTISGITSNGKTDMVYTRDGSDIYIDAQPKAIIGFGKSCLDFVEKNGTKNGKTYSANFSTSIAFGNGVDVGEYEVRYVAYETFTFDDKTYEVARYSDDCVYITVRKADLTMPSVDLVQVEYGTSVSEISTKIKDFVSDKSFVKNGDVFSLRDNQPDSSFDGVSDIGSVIPSVKDGGYTLAYDFTSASGNYNTVENIEVGVVVKPRKIIVRIPDVVSLVGEALKPLDQIAYTLDGTLVGADSQSDLGVKIVCDADGDVAGVYTIYAAFDNPNYEADSKNALSPFIAGGRYMVFTRKVDAVAPDGTSFQVYCDEGFILFKDVKITVLQALRTVPDRRIVRAYRIELTDDAGKVVMPDGKFYVSWSGDMDGAQYVSIGEGQLFDIGLFSGGAELDKNNCELYFYVDDYTTKGNESKWQTILLVSVAVLFVFGIAALWLGCRQAMRIGSLLRDGSVYTRESIQDSNDAVLSQQGVDSDKTQRKPCDYVKNESISSQANRDETEVLHKKQRHGKANKQRNGKKGGGRKE